MRVVLAETAVRDLDEILATMAANYPAALRPFEIRLRASLKRIGAWPESAQTVEQRPGVRMVPLVRYPFKIFYRVSNEVVEVLHIHHARRLAP